MEAEHRMARADASSGQEQDALQETVTAPEATAVPVETPGMLAPNLDKQANAGTKSTLLDSLDGVGVSAEDPFFQKVDLSTKGVKREIPTLNTQLDRIEAGEKRVTALLEVQRDLFETIDAQKEELTALRQERRALISKTDAQEEMERELLNEHQKVLDEFGAEKESLGKLLQESKREVGVRKQRESVLLQERQALIDEIRALQQEKKQSSSTNTVKGKKLKIEQVEVEVMISHWQKDLLDLILGCTKVASEAAAALPGPPDETQTMEQTTRDCSGAQSE